MDQSVQPARSPVCLTHHSLVVSLPLYRSHALHSSGLSDDFAVIMNESSFNHFTLGDIQYHPRETGIARSLWRSLTNATEVVDG
jgi:hypothetical protein